MSSWLAHRWLQLFVAAVVLPLYLINSFRFDTPVGYAGLFSLFSDALRQNNFIIPFNVPFYGPGGVPFAYPPLGFYLAAVLTKITKLSMFQYLRWAPAIFSLLAFLAMYAFFKGISWDSQKAALAVLIVACSEITYTTHATAAGMVRGLALWLSLLAGFFAWKSFESQHLDFRKSALAAFFLGLTFLTHLSYGVFLAMGIILMAIWRDRLSLTRLSIKTLSILGLITLVVITPWLTFVHARYGLQVLMGVSDTHGTLGVMHRTGGIWRRIPLDIVSGFLNLGRTWTPYLLSGLAVLAFVYGLKRGRWLLPVWLMFLPLVLGESDRFGIILAGLLIGELVIDLVRDLPTWKPHRIMSKELIQSFAVVLVMGPIIWQGVKSIPRSQPTLDPEIMQLSDWIRKHTSMSSTYLFLDDGHDLSEWMPYLLQRTPPVAHWGSEWTGMYQSQLLLKEELHRCLEQSSFRCILDMFGGSIPIPDLLIIPGGQSTMAAEILADPGWVQVLVSEHYCVFQHID